MKRIVYCLTFLFLFLLIDCKIVEAKIEIKLPGDYKITVNKNEKKYENLNDKYFSCKYSGTRQGKKGYVVYVVFEDDYVYISTNLKSSESTSILSSDDKLMEFKKNGNGYSLGNGSYRIDTVFDDIMWNNKYLYDSEKFSGNVEILNANLKTDSFKQKEDSICPYYFNISQKNGVYDFKLSNTPDTSGVYLASAGVTDIEQELNECVKNKDCQIPSSNNDDKKDDNNTNSTIACAYQYEMNGAKQSVVFTFEKGKNDSKYSLTINDTSSGIKKYRNDEAIYNSSIPNDYLDGTKCFNELYLINHNEQYLWINPGNPAFDYYGTPITMKNTNDSNNDSASKDNDMDLSGCIIDEGTQSIIDWIMNLIRIGGVILLVVLGMLDFVKAAASGEQEEMKKSKSKFVKRLIACVVLFFVPIIVKILVGLVNLGSGESCNSNDSNDKTDDSNNRVSYQCSCKYYRSNVDEPNISDVSLSFDVTNKDNFDSHTINYNGKNVTVKINSPQKNATSSTDMLCPKKCSFDESKKVLTCSSTDNDETFQNNNPHFYQAADENGKLLENCKILTN